MTKRKLITYYQFKNRADLENMETILKNNGWWRDVTAISSDICPNVIALFDHHEYDIMNIPLGETKENFINIIINTKR